MSKYRIKPKKQTRAKGTGGVSYSKITRRWQGSYMLGNQKKYVYSRISKADCSMKLNRHLVLVADGIITGNEVTFNDYSSVWLEHIEKMGEIKFQTLRAYKLNIKRAISYLGKYKLNDIKPIMIEQMYMDLKEKMSNSSVNQVHRTIKTMYAHAMKSDKAIKNVPALCKAPKPSKRNPVVLSRNDWNQVINVSKTEENGLLVEFLLKTGMRVNVEALSSKWDDIDFQKKSLNVSKSKTKAGEGRTIPLEHELFMRLKTKYDLLQLKRKKSPMFNLDNYIFCNEMGERENYANIRNRLWKRIKKKLSISNNIRMHDLRHNFGSYLLSEQVPITMVSKILGHADVSITLSVYSHELPEDYALVEQALNRIESRVA